MFGAPARADDRARCTGDDAYALWALVASAVSALSSDLIDDHGLGNGDLRGVDLQDLLAGYRQVRAVPDAVGAGVTATVYVSADGSRHYALTESRHGLEGASFATHDHAVTWAHLAVLLERALRSSLRPPASAATSTAAERCEHEMPCSALDPLLKQFVFPGLTAGQLDIAVTFASEAMPVEDARRAAEKLEPSGREIRLPHVARAAAGQVLEP